MHLLQSSAGILLPWFSRLDFPSPAVIARGLSIFPHGKKFKEVTKTKTLLNIFLENGSKYSRRNSIRLGSSN